jgi:hypothetical protein
LLEIAQTAFLLRGHSDHPDLRALPGPFFFASVTELPNSAPACAGGFFYLHLLLSHQNCLMGRVQNLTGFLAFGAILMMKAMRTLAEYLKHAEECRRLAESMAAPEDKRLLQELAQTWERLARMRQKDITADGIEIPPEPKL